jgi:competence protein ComGF
MAKKKSAKYLNEHAFTLIETLFAFSIFIMLIFFISPIFQVMLNNKDLNERLQVMEWDVFSSQIKKEIRMSQRVQVIDGNLELTKNSQIILYEKYNNLIRRRVNNTGHEVLLQNIAEVNFTLLNQGVRITVKSLVGKIYSLSIYAFFDWNISA